MGWVELVEHLQQIHSQAVQMQCEGRWKCFSKCRSNLEGAVEGLAPEAVPALAYGHVDDEGAGQLEGAGEVLALPWYTS